MWLIEELKKAIAGDPPKPNVTAYCSLEQERLNLEHERDVYKLELIRLGYRPEMLLAMTRANAVEVKAS